VRESIRLPVDKPQIGYKSANFDPLDNSSGLLTA
jgi:hypothetical protein